MTLQSEARFSNFVKRQQERKADTRSIDWQKEKDEWLEHLDQLYDEIKSYLAEYTKDGSIRLRKSEEELHEENIGTYLATRLMLIIGDQTVTLKPIGTLLIGSKGRVDVEGLAGTSRLVLINENIKNLKQIIQVEDHISLSGQPAEPMIEPKAELPKQINWVWKIASRPPTGGFVELNKDTFLQMLLEVSNG